MVRRRQLGAALRRHRIAVGMTVKEVAERLLVAPSKISRIERAERNATLRDVRDLCDLYGIADAGLRDQLMDLARGSRERGWWQDAPLTPALKTLIGMEGSARQIHEYQILTVPGLLQTRDYADAIGMAYFPDDSGIRQSVVDARMRRQQILDEPSPPKMDVVFDEAALQRVIGSPAIMRDQLDHLVRVIDEKVAEVRVIPFSAGAHIGMDTGFSILEFDRPDMLSAEALSSSVVYVETFYGATYLDEPSSVNRYLTAYAQLAGAALEPRDTREYLISAARHF